ncbi:MAG: nascent polypeptide-associated complex protein [Nanoarchaeota archaeon]
MLPNLDPKKMQAMMKQLGIAQEEINAERVIIEKENSNIIIENPNIVKIKMRGQESFQIIGEVREEADSIQEDKKTEDIKVIVDKIRCSEEEAKRALEKADGDLTEALLSFDD